MRSTAIADRASSIVTIARRSQPLPGHVRSSSPGVVVANRDAGFVPRCPAQGRRVAAAPVASAAQAPRGIDARRPRRPGTSTIVAPAGGQASCGPADDVAGSPMKLDAPVGRHPVGPAGAVDDQVGDGLAVDDHADDPHAGFTGEAVLVVRPEDRLELRQPAAGDRHRGEDRRPGPTSTTRVATSWSVDVVGPPRSFRVTQSRAPRPSTQQIRSTTNSSRQAASASAGH